MSQLFTGIVRVSASVSMSLNVSGMAGARGAAAGSEKGSELSVLIKDWIGSESLSALALIILFNGSEVGARSLTDDLTIKDCMGSEVGTSSDFVWASRGERRGTSSGIGTVRGVSVVLCSRTSSPCVERYHSRQDMFSSLSPLWRFDLILVKIVQRAGSSFVSCMRARVSICRARTGSCVEAGIV
jgi:hypothetical protein